MFRRGRSENREMTAGQEKIEKRAEKKEKKAANRKKQKKNRGLQWRIKEEDKEEE